jgi:anti-anti-sigma factor
MATFVPAPQLDIRSRAFGEHRVVVEVRGGIDLATADALEAELRRLSDEEIVLDLSQVDFIDCTGVELLFRTAGRFTLGAVSSAVERVLRLCNFEMQPPDRRSSFSGEGDPAGRVRRHRYLGVRP